MRSIEFRILIAACVFALLASCTTYTTTAPGPGPPLATTPQNSALVFEWAVNTSHPEAIEALLAAGAGLLSADVDSAGNPSAARLSREEVVAGFRSMLDGVPGRYAPARASIVLDRNLVSFPDPRPDSPLDLDPVVYRAIRTRFHLNVNDLATGSRFEISGALTFHAVRGDSVELPPGSTEGADSRHWWLDGIDEETAGAASTNASTPVTLLELLDYFRRRLSP